MASKHTCPCFKCKSGRDVTRKTLYTHFRQNQDHLDQLTAIGANQDILGFVQGCHYQMIDLLNSLTEGTHVEQSGSSYPGGEAGEHLISYNFDHLLICLDLADAPIGSPQFLEGELAEDDAMIVDDNCE